MRSDPTTSLDLTAPEVVADPYPFFAEERAAHPVAWHEPTRMWLTFDHATVGRGARGTAGSAGSGRTSEPADYLEPFNLLHRNQMMENEPPEHTRLRRPVSAAFNRGHVERLRPRVRELAATLLDRADPDGFDVIGGVRRAAAGPGDRRAARRAVVVRRRPAALVAGDRADVRGGARRGGGGLRR